MGYGRRKKGPGLRPQNVVRSQTADGGGDKVTFQERKEMVRDLIAGIARQRPVQQQKSYRDCHMLYPDRGGTSIHTGITTCYILREEGPQLIPGLPHVISLERRDLNSYQDYYMF